MIFIDTSAWIALEDKKDINHGKAIKFKQELVSLKKRLFTTNYILDETFTLMLLNLGFTPTVRFKHKIYNLIESNILIVFHIDKAIEENAWQIFELYNRDKFWSFTDCTSKAIMDDYSITESFTFDKHFDQMSFIRKP